MQTNNSVVESNTDLQLEEGYEMKKVNAFNKVSMSIGNVKSKISNFLKEEKSARGFTEEAWLTYGALIIGIALLVIAVQFLTGGFNDVGNFFVDGVNGKVDQSGLNQWGDETNGFNRK